MIETEHVSIIIIIPKPQTALFPLDSSLPKKSISLPQHYKHFFSTWGSWSKSCYCCCYCHNFSHELVVWCSLVQWAICQSILKYLKCGNSGTLTLKWLLKSTLWARSPECLSRSFNACFHSASSSSSSSSLPLPLISTSHHQHPNQLPNCCSLPPPLPPPFLPPLCSFLCLLFVVWEIASRLPKERKRERTLI